MPDMPADMPYHLSTVCVQGMSRHVQNFVMGGHHCFEGGMSGHVRDLGTGGGGTDMPDLLRMKREDGADMPGYYVPPESNRRTCQGYQGLKHAKYTYTVTGGHSIHISEGTVHVYEA